LPPPVAGGVDVNAISALTGLTPGAAGIWLFGTIFLLGWSLKAVAEWRQWRQLSLEEKQANREGFTAQVALLSKQLRDANERVRLVAADLQTERDAHDEYRRLCHAETEQLRGHIIRLENDIAALHRRETTAQLPRLDDLDPARAPLAAATVERVTRIVAGDSPETT